MIAKPIKLSLMPLTMIQLNIIDDISYWPPTAQCWEKGQVLLWCVGAVKESTRRGFEPKWMLADRWGVKGLTDVYISANLHFTMTATPQKYVLGTPQMAWYMTITLMNCQLVSNKPFSIELLCSSVKLLYISSYQSSPQGSCVLSVKLRNSLHILIWIKWLQCFTFNKKSSTFSTTNLR